MPGPITISCPSCQAKLKLKDESKLGKQVACPSCQNSFVLKHPEDEVEELSDFVDADEDEDDFADLAPPPRSKKRSGGSSSSRSRRVRIEGVVGLDDDMTLEELNEELENGAKFVIYKYCFSVIILTFLQPTKIHFIPAGGSSVGPGLGYSILTFFVGWWGFPWGPIYSIMALANNFGGGTDVTDEVVGGLG